MADVDIPGNRKQEVRAAQTACRHAESGVAHEFAEQTVGDMPPGSPLVLANLRDGWDVLPASHALRLEAVGGPVVFDIAILGVLAGGGSSSAGS